jgi:hypothetical protein
MTRIAIVYAPIAMNAAIPKLTIPVKPVLSCRPSATIA